ncbi:MAG: OmpA family protein [Salinivirgaceae bacterium]|nr:OmpA family protein [Salinivirgaceae bacterium]MDD4746765.1 OmpA family protein [Salinivirgaceae bacterium]
MRRLLFTLISVLLITVLASAQNSVKKLLREGEISYSNQDYNEALASFLLADSLSKNDLRPAYWIGVTYLSIKGKELHAIPYLERSLRMRNLPYDVHKNLGTLYHQTFLFDKAIQQFSAYLGKALPNDGFIAYCERMIEISANAKKVAGRKAQKSINALPQRINKGYSEYAPFISADMQTLVFTRFDFPEHSLETDQLIKSFFISRSTDGQNWSNPIKLILPSKHDITKAELAGISLDGFTLYLSMGEPNRANLYSAKINENKLENIVPLPSNINSLFGESRITFSADGSSCIFSSNRPGGIGESDLYRSDLNPDGSWTLPVNLGTTINTPFNEDAPFWHPDGKRFIFASEGHSSIGGYDLFETQLNEDKFWQTPVGINYANTVYDDKYFMIDAKGEKAFFAQSLNYFPGRFKIFTTDLQENIPLTMVKGSIKIGNPPKPLATKIKVYDNETKKRVKYTYSPNEYTGKYLMIFPPGRNYDIVIEAEGFLPHLINVYIPEQSYFYELFQEITLESIEIKNKRVGENIRVRNTFYDIYKTPLSDTLVSDLNKDDQKNYDHLLQIIGDIIYQTDSIGLESLEQLTTQSEKKNVDPDYSSLFSLIGEAIESTDSLSLSVLDQNTLYDEVVVSPTYYQQNDPKKSLVASIYGQDTVITAPPIKSDEQRIIVPKIAEQHDSTKIFQNSKISDRYYVYHEKIYFDVNDIAIEAEYYPILNAIAHVMHNNPKFGIEIHGYTDPQGTEAYNHLLSERRAKAALKHIVGQGIARYHAIVIPHGVDNAPIELSNKEDLFGMKRRVELKIFEIKTND